MALPKARKKSKPARVSKKYDTKFIGQEPKGLDLTKDAMEFSRVLNWYVYMGDMPTSKKYAIAHFKAKGDADVVEKLEKLDNARIGFIPNLGWFCRMLDQGCTLPDEALESMTRYIQDLDDLVKRQEDADEEREGRAKFRVKKLPHSQRIINDVEARIETFKGDFVKIDLHQYAMKHGSPANALKEVGEHFSELLTELEELVGLDLKKVRKDAKLREKLLEKGDYDKLTDGSVDDMAIQLDEGYRHYDEKQRIALRDTVKQVVDQAGYVKQVMKAEKQADKPVEPKRLSAEKQTKGMKFLQKDDDFKLVSLSPMALVGARKAWFWHKKYKQIVYAISEEGGFECKGQGIFNVKEAKNRTVKKPETFFSDGFTKNPKRRDVMFNELNTTIYNWNARMAEHVVILAVE